MTPGVTILGCATKHKWIKFSEYQFYITKADNYTFFHTVIVRNMWDNMRQRLAQYLAYSKCSLNLSMNCQIGYPIMAWFICNFCLQLKGFQLYHIYLGRAIYHNEKLYFLCSKWINFPLNLISLFLFFLFFLLWILMCVSWETFFLVYASILIGCHELTNTDYRNIWKIWYCENRV